MAALSLPIKGVRETGDTIFALSSGSVPSAVAVVRISGSRAGEALRALIGRLPEARRAVLARVRDPLTAESIDQALALWFPGPASETGEDMAEVQLHGGRAVVAALFSALKKLEGLRLAEPGEFTRRAFEHGRLDLTRVEALADLIYADTEAQRQQAFRHMRGMLGDRAEGWRRTLIEAMALVEAAIDFPDEGDVPRDLLEPALSISARLCREIEETLASGTRGERLREGLTVAIAGPPNVGKSSLLNRIARREAAIVSPVPGTRFTWISQVFQSRCSTRPVFTTARTRLNRRAFGVRVPGRRAPMWFFGSWTQKVPRGKGSMPPLREKLVG